jgi:hypothetical protein
VAYLASRMIDKLVVCRAMRPFVTTKVAPRHFREYGARKAEGKGRSNAQAAANASAGLQSRGRLTRLL